MEFKNKTFIVGDLAVVTSNKYKGSIRYIGEVIGKSDAIYIGITIRLTPNRKTDIDDNNKICSIVYFESSKNKKCLFIEKSQIINLFRGTDNIHLSRKWKINDRVYIKSLKCKGYIKSMWLKPPKYIIDNIINKKKQILKSKIGKNVNMFGDNNVSAKTKIGKHYYGILLDKPLGNNDNKQQKYFNCPDNTDYYCKSKFVFDVPNQRLSLCNKELIISYWYKNTCISLIFPLDLILLISKYSPAKDGSLRISKNSTYKLPEECIHEDDYYEYDSIKLRQKSKLIGKYIVLKCFGDMMLQRNSIIDVSGESPNEYECMNGKCGGAGGVIKIICFGNITIQKGAKILANGGRGSGDGSGGQIYIECFSLINDGQILANRGNYRPRSCGPWTPPNGGRIIIKTNTGKVHSGGYSEIDPKPNHASDAKLLSSNF